jgi:hypothetical protein
MVFVVLGARGGALAGEPGIDSGFVENFVTPPGLDGFVVRGQQPQGYVDPTGCATGGNAACDPTWIVYGEFLYLRPGNDKVAFAVPINGAIVPPVGAPPVQVGPEVLVDLGFTPGVRVGAERAYGTCSALGGQFTWYESNQTNNAVGTELLPLYSLVNHPGSLSAATNSLAATATGHIDFQLGDAFYRRFLVRDENRSLSFIGGARFAHLDETFRSTFTSATTVETVNTNIAFDGGGIRLGLEAEQRASFSQGLVYAKGYASFVGGQFTSRYVQADGQRGVVVDTGWTEDRVVSILDTELGIGWITRHGIRITGGYMFSGWFNLINTDDFIRAVRKLDSVNVRDSLSFDGFVVRAEARF